MDIFGWKGNEMENIAPSLDLLLKTKRNLEKGQSVRVSIENYIKMSSSDFANVVSKWYVLQQRGLSTHDLMQTLDSQYRRALLHLLERSLRGESVYNQISALESEIIDACGEEISNKLARLPFLMLIPLLLMQFPAILLLLFGPLLQNFFHSLG